MPFGVTLDTVTEPSTLSVTVTPTEDPPIWLYEKAGIGRVTVAMKVCVDDEVFVTTTLLVMNGSFLSVAVQLLTVYKPVWTNGFVNVHVLLPSALAVLVPSGAKLAEQVPSSQIWTVTAWAEPEAKTIAATARTNPKERARTPNPLFPRPIGEQAACQAPPHP